MKLFKMRSFNTLLLGGLVSLSLNSHAILIEPIIGMGTTTYEAAASSLNGDDDAPTSVYTGLKLGTELIDVGVGSLFVTADYRMTSSKLKLAGNSIDFNRTLLGLNAGVDLPLVRAWVSHYFQDKMDFSGNLIEDAENSTTGVGVSLGFIPFVEINVELLKTSGDDQDIDTLIASVSLPLDL